MTSNNADKKGKSEKGEKAEKPEKVEKPDAKAKAAAAAAVEGSGGAVDGEGPTTEKVKGAKKSAAKPAAKGGDEGPKKTKKRKAEGEAAEKPPKPKKKKEEPKPKVPKPKGPVDVEKHCGVPLPNGGHCARSLTCKSHSMGAKRAVPGRSLPYDMLLHAYQKKNQAKQQKAAIDANAPLQDDLENNGGPVDSDEEKDAIMAAIARSCPQPLESNIMVPTQRKYQYVRMKEMLSNALAGSRGRGLFAVGDAGARGSLSAVEPESAA